MRVHYKRTVVQREPEQWDVLAGDLGRSRKRALCVSTPPAANEEEKKTVI